jgi:hypothetical protein
MLKKPPDFSMSRSCESHITKTDSRFWKGGEAYVVHVGCAVLANRPAREVEGRAVLFWNSLRKFDMKSCLIFWFGEVKSRKVHIKPRASCCSGRQVGAS